MGWLSYDGIDIYNNKQLPYILGMTVVQMKDEPTYLITYSVSLDYIDFMQ